MKKNKLGELYNKYSKYVGTHNWCFTFGVAVVDLFISINCFPDDYEQAIVKGKTALNSTLVSGTASRYETTIYILDLLWGKTATISLLSASSLIIFLIAWYQYIKQKRKR
jgi:hypothetical protein